MKIALVEVERSLRNVAKENPIRNLCRVKSDIVNIG